MSDSVAEVSRGERFEFGKNWAAFLRKLDEGRIETAVTSIEAFLETKSLDGRRVIDIGSGSGVFSLAARRLGAEVYSFDFDPDSVGCTQELRRRYFPNDPRWTVSQGSVLDRTFLDSLGQFDIVYSWGVLHHTGQMWQALENAAGRVAPGGQLFIAIYNDQGGTSRRWLAVKKLYNSLPGPLRFLVTWPFAAHVWWRPVLKDFLKLRPLASLRDYHEQRGMSPWHDVVDWVGGLPFEVASPEAIFDFYRARGFQLEKLTTAGGSMGCNQFVFRRT